ncbi:RDD family protein [Agrococcus beijingensis]|uniref:RDD family protein n=1 Tax=Agrococcus beijingensis TaxID=3068634 RepID=UPI0027425E35|nr:RDD family protein [Agrococcus sp. REN33]
MTSSQPPVSQPPGWYPDPYAAAPGVERWWDGANWIAQTRDPVPAQPTWSPAPWQTPPAPAAASTDASQQQLAGFGSRALAYLIDLIPFVVLAAIVLGQFGYFEIVDRLAAGDDAALADLEAMASAGSAASVTTVVVGAIAYFLYNVGFHRWKGQTPGKMLVGIRVRMADDDRRPTGRAAVIRWAVQQGGPQLLSTVPIIGLFASIFTVVDHVWPLFDAERRALHDKAAGTIVVRAR